MSSRLIIAIALSLALHGALLLPGTPTRLPGAPPRPALRAELQAAPAPLPAAAEALLKDTLAAAEKPPEASAPPPPIPPARAAVRKPSRAGQEIQAARRKLSRHLFYPPQAVARGLEGEVRLLIRLSADGAIDDVGIAASSGHPILDDAAVRAAWAMGRLTGVGQKEMILPVIFRLQ